MVFSNKQIKDLKAEQIIHFKNYLGCFDKGSREYIKIKEILTILEKSK